MENNIPQGWIECSLGEILRAKKGKKPQSVITEPKPSYIPYILIDEMEGKPVRTFTNDPKVSVINEDDVLLVWDGSIGKCGSGMRGAIGSTLVGLTPLCGIPTKFLEYTVKHQNNFIKETSTGTGLQHINKDFFEICKIQLPPLPEQHRILAKLDAVMDKITQNKERLDRIPALLKRFRQSVLAAAVSGKLTEDWRVRNNVKGEWIEYEVRELTDLLTSGSRGWAKYYSAQGSTFVRAQNISKDILDLSDIAHVKLPSPQEGIRTLIKKKDILITITGANVTKAALVSDEIENAYVSQHVALLRLKNPEISRFVYLHVISDGHGRKQLLQSAYGQGKPQLNLDNIKDVKISLPLKEEMAEIISRVEQYLSLISKIETRYNEAATQIDRMPQSILAKAFRGELVPQDPNDEPAAQLLERIKREQGMKKKGKEMVL